MAKVSRYLGLSLIFLSPAGAMGCEPRASASNLGFPALSAQLFTPAAPSAEPKSSPDGLQSPAPELAAIQAKEAENGDLTRPLAEPCGASSPLAPACGEDRLSVPWDLSFPPRRQFPPEEIRQVLDQVAQAMRKTPEWQMLRVEVYPGRDPGADQALRRRQVFIAQARADAIFNYLYRGRRITAERLDSVGYAYTPTLGAEPGVEWPVVLRLVHRAPSSPEPEPED